MTDKLQEWHDIAYRAMTGEDCDIPHLGGHLFDACEHIKELEHALKVMESNLENAFQIREGKDIEIGDLLARVDEMERHEATWHHWWNENAQAQLRIIKLREALRWYAGMRIEVIQDSGTGISYVTHKDPLGEKASAALEDDT